MVGKSSLSAGISFTKEDDALIDSAEVGDSPRLARGGDAVGGAEG